MGMIFINLLIAAPEFIFSAFGVLLQAGTGNAGLPVYEIDGRLIDGHWIFGRNHTDIPYNGCIVEWGTVAGRGDIRDKIEE